MSGGLSCRYVDKTSCNNTKIHTHVVVCVRDPVWFWLADVSRISCTRPPTSVLPDAIFESLEQEASKSSKLSDIQGTSPADLASEVASLRALLKNLKAPVAAMQSQAVELDKRRQLRDKAKAEEQKIQARIDALVHLSRSSYPLQPPLVIYITS